MACALALISCDVDDGPTIMSTYAEVIHAELPDYFEKGETYEINVTYILPSACHEDAGMEARRGARMGSERRNIFIVGYASYDPSLSECTEEEEDLEREKEFSITIDEEEPYTFFLWTGNDVDGDHIFTEIEVPVGEQETSES